MISYNTLMGFLSKTSVMKDYFVSTDDAVTIGLCDCVTMLMDYLKNNDEGSRHNSKIFE